MCLCSPGFGSLCALFSSWIAAVSEVTTSSVVAIDGKMLRRSFDKGSEKSTIHMVSAWADCNQLVLGQVRTEEKSNGITAIPKLLSMLALSGCIVMIDAMGRQKKITVQIVDKGADYVLSLKGNQETMEVEVRKLFDWAVASKFKDVEHVFLRRLRRIMGDLRSGGIGAHRMWIGLKAVMGGAGFSISGWSSQRGALEKRSRERGFYISSVNGKDAKRFAYAGRSHWGIENKLHWVLDEVFREEESRIRKDHSAANFSTLRHIALNLLKQEKPPRWVSKSNASNPTGVKCKNYLLKVLGI